MSIGTAKVTELGILIGENQKKSIIVPLRISVNSEDKFRKESYFGKRLFHLLAQNFSRYTIIYDKKDETSFEFRIYVYFSLISGKESVLELKQTLKRFKDLLLEYNYKLSLIDSQQTLNLFLERLPSHIEEYSPSKFRITTKQDPYYLTIANFVFNDEPDKKAFFSFLKDFLVLSPLGRVNIDVINSRKKSQGIYQRISEVAITLVLDGKNGEEIVVAQKKLLPIMKMLSDLNQQLSGVKINFIDKTILLENFGKIIFGQGWRYFVSDYKGILDFDYHFSLLL